MTRAEVIAQARDSSGKLGADPDMLELMAIRIWDAAFATSSKIVQDEIDDCIQNKAKAKVHYERFLRTGGHAARQIGPAIKGLLDVAPSYLRSARRRLQSARIGDE